MDAGLLRAIAEEIRHRLVEQEVQRVSDLGSGRLLLRVATPGRDNLLISVRPDLPRLHLLPRGGGRREIPPGPFAAVLERELAGARLASVAVPPGERIAALGFRRADLAGADSERRLIAEMFGRAAAAHLLDAGGRVIATTRRGDRGGPVEGERYQAPVPRASIPEDGTGAVEAESFEVHSVRPLEELTETVPIGRGDLLLATGRSGEPPVHATTGQPLHVTRFASPSEAAAAVLERLETRRDFEAERARHQARARKEVARLAALEDRLIADREGAGRALENRRRAEALLAGLHAAKVQGSEVVVPDPESMTGATMSVPIDPALSLPANAERLFDRFKKGKRALAAIDTRLAAVRRRRAEWAGVEAKSVAAATAADLEPVREAMAALGLVHRTPRPGRPAGAAVEAPTRVRRHTTHVQGGVALGFLAARGRPRRRSRHRAQPAPAREPAGHRPEDRGGDRRLLQRCP
jgi:predicted ribosome quality control (RQC) complex YloA/Tae2 family protein